MKPFSAQKYGALHQHSTGLLCQRQQKTVEDGTTEQLLMPLVI
jgi:hypothetical protein